MASFVGNFPRLIALTAVFGLLVDASLGTLSADPISWRLEWPRTDFSKHSVPFAGIKSGGPPKDGIPAIDAPRFERLADGKATGSSAALGDTERVVDGRVLDFGTTGKLRNSDLVMYDRQTESWWQQFTGEAIVGAMTGHHLRLIPSRLESFDRFRQRFPQGKVLIPNNPNARNYGRNPYVGYDATGRRPFLYDGLLPDGIEPMERVVAVEVVPGRHQAWALALLRRRGTIESADLLLQWQPGQASALDKSTIPAGRDVGNVIVQRRQDDQLVDVPYDVTFAFVFHAFRPNSPIHKDVSDTQGFK